MTDAKAIVLLEGLFVYIVRSIKEKTLSTYIDQNTVLSYVGKYHVTVHRMVPIDTPLLLDQFPSLPYQKWMGLSIFQRF